MFWWIITLWVFSAQGILYVGGNWICDRPNHLFRKKYKKNISGNRCCREMNALCVRHKVSLIRGPNRETRPPPGSFLSEKGFLTPPSLVHPCIHATPGHPVLSLAPSLSPAHLLRPPTPVLSLITWGCLCSVVVGSEPMA